jgi:small GTP-binding protein
MIERANKPHLGIFGRRNHGKSSLINAITGKEIAVVSDMPGTTTEPVYHSVEIAGLGYVVLIDTAGIDDLGELGELKNKKNKQIIDIIDLAILVMAGNKFGIYETEILSDFRERDVPVVFVHNKCDLQPLNDELGDEIEIKYDSKTIEFSTLQSGNLEELIETIRTCWH